MNRKSKFKRGKMVTIILVIVLLVSIGFAYLSSVLNIDLDVLVKRNEWNIHFANINILPTSNVTATQEPTINNENKTEVNFSISLLKPGDRYEFYVDVVNDGTIDGMIEKVQSTINGNRQLPSYLVYTTTYKGNFGIDTDQLLKSTKTKTIKVSIIYRDDIESKDLPQEDQTLNVNFNVTYVQADSKAKDIDTSTICDNNLNVVPKKNTLCKRAENLTSFKVIDKDGNDYFRSAYGVGQTVSVGSCGETGVLTPGDVFVCDFDGDGVYKNIEKFYYVSPKDGVKDSEYLTFLREENYYRNKYHGYNNYSGMDNWLIRDFTEHYNPKFNLANKSRQLKNELGTTVVGGDSEIHDLPTFTYSYQDKDSSERLLTVQEIEYALGHKLEINTPFITKQFEFLLSPGLNDNYWLENPYSKDTTSAMYIDASSGSLSYANVSEYMRIKTVIEVNKSQVMY